MIVCIRFLGGDQEAPDTPVRVDGLSLRDLQGDPDLLEPKHLRPGKPEVAVQLEGGVGVREVVNHRFGALRGLAMGCASRRAGDLHPHVVVGTLFKPELHILHVHHGVLQVEIHVVIEGIVIVIEVGIVVGDHPDCDRIRGRIEVDRLFYRGVVLELVPDPAPGKAQGDEAQDPGAYQGQPGVAHLHIALFNQHSRSQHHEEEKGYPEDQDQADRSEQDLPFGANDQGNRITQGNHGHAHPGKEGKDEQDEQQGSDEDQEDPDEFGEELDGVDEDGTGELEELPDYVRRVTFFFSGQRVLDIPDPVPDVLLYIGDIGLPAPHLQFVRGGPRLRDQHPEDHIHDERTAHPEDEEDDEEEPQPDGIADPQVGADPRGDTPQDPVVRVPVELPR